MSQSVELSTTKRWALVSERLRQESQAMPLETKFAQLAALMASVDDFKWREALGADDDRVREVWIRLRAALPRG